MKCPNCGTENADGAKFCITCGKALPENSNQVLEVPTDTQANQFVSSNQNVSQNDFMPNPKQGFNPNPQPDFNPNGGFDPNAAQNQGFNTNPQPGFNPNGGFDPNNAQNQGFNQNPQAGFNPNPAPGFNPNGAPGSQMNFAPKKPIDKDLILFISSIAACVACVIAFFVAGNNAFGYMSVGKRYYYAQVTNNFGDSYDYLDVKETDFINKDQFVKLYSAKKDELQYFDPKSLKKDTFSGDLKSGGKEATLYVTFNPELNNQYKGTSIPLVRKGNIFGIFPNWKVDKSDVLVENVTFNVPQNTVFELEGIKVDDKYITEKESEEGYTVYVIPELFNRPYQASCSVEGFAAKPEIEAVSTDGVFYLSYGQPDQDTMDSICQKAYDDFTTVMNSCVEGKPFSDVSSIFSNGEGTYDKNLYENIQQDMAEDPSSKGLISISFSNVKGDASFRAYSDTPVITVELEATMDITYNFQDWFYGTVTPEADSEHYDARYYYVLKDGQWIIDGDSSMIVPSLYVYYGF